MIAMRYCVLILVCFLQLTVNISVKAQLPIAEFLAPGSVCLNQRIDFVNLSQNADFYEWDFCEGDLLQVPTGLTIGSLSDAFNPKEMDVVKAGDNWYGFATSRNTNAIYRISYGTNLNNPTPQITNLGNIGNALAGPEQIKLVQENGTWYGLVVNSSTSTLMRLIFGESLESTPTIELIASNISAANSGMDIGITNDEIVVIVTNSVNQTLQIINLRNSIENTPQPLDIITVSAPLGASSLDDINLIRSDGQWYALLIAFNSRTIYRLDFGASLFMVPSFSQIITPSFATNERPSGVKMTIDAGRFIGIVQTFNGSLFRLDFGANIVNSNPTVTSLGNLGLLANSVNFECVKDGSNWYGFVINQTSRTIARISFPNICFANISSSNEWNPTGIEYTASQTYFASLIARKGNNYDYYSKAIDVSSNMAPDIEFSSQNVCINHNVEFTSQNTSENITSYAWDFGDMNTSSVPDPVHIYTTAGNYEVRLSVIASNGCGNLERDHITIFNQPIVDFNLPAVSPICTNQNYEIINNSIFEAALTPVWEWSVNGQVVTTNQNLNFAFQSPVSQELKLIASIPGCTSEIVKTINSVTEGPLVNFSSSGQCQDAAVTFTNETTGAVNGYSWNFGDGQNSTDEDPLNSYGSPGTFDVTLTAFGTSGCNNTKTESVTIHSKPQTDFSVALPPFSCSGTPTQFTDITPNPFDSNLASWQWNFGDGTGSSTARNPQYTFQNAGDYSVSLTAITNFGCSSTIQRLVTISASPVASFTNSPPCLGVPISFTNTSTGLLQSQQWQIQSSFYTVANPVHAFLTSGDKNVTLNVTATNGCISSVTRTLNVPAVLTPDFSVSRNCINQQTEFTDMTNDAADAVVGYAWNFAGLGNGTENPQVFSFANTGNFNVSLSVTTQTGCVHSAAKNVSIINSPQANFIATPSFGPPPLQVQFTNTSTNATSYLWQFNDPNSSSSTSVSPSFTFSELGSYEVGLTAFNAQGCSTLFSRLIEVVIPFTNVALTQLELIETGQASVKPAVTIQNKSNIAITNLPLIFEVDGTAFRTFVTTSIPPNSSYYHLSDFELPAPSSLSYVCALAEIEDTSPNDNQLCASVDQPIVVLAPYPNPATAQSHIEVQWIVRENRAVEVLLINSIGQTVYSESVNSVSGLNTFRLSATGFQTGLYFLLVRSGDFSRTHRLMVLE